MEEPCIFISTYLYILKPHKAEYLIFEHMYSIRECDYTVNKDNVEVIILLTKVASYSNSI